VLIKKLNHAEKVQSIDSVPLSLHIYWSSVFVLPKRVIRMVESKCREWGRKNLSQWLGKTFVGLKDKGLEIKTHAYWNKALLS